ncbi:phage integrase central domain-containing protein [Pseudomonas frederiksbergensis]|uniref:phage integrase central domain-containing protein n=1 Tax=Pseudomonas frederiksbergensis TaxID=104087 RepID=UPI003D22DC1A
MTQGVEFEGWTSEQLSQINRIFGKDVLPWLGPLSVFEIVRRGLLEVVRKIERRGALTTAEK